jgi:hypothetical protein
MSSELEALAAAVRGRHAILFAGAGVSMCVGLPSWSELIAHMCSELQLDPNTFPAAETGYHTLAEYYRLKMGSIGPLRSWMDKSWSVSEERVRHSRVHELIVSLGFPIIYTTNYDANLEIAFTAFGHDYVKVASARDVARAQGDATQIVKFHGDFEDDASLVIAETDYFSRLRFASPLDIKFRADALGRTVLFIGYSMSDLNIRLLLHRLWETWRDSGQENDRPRSFVFMPRANPIHQSVLGQWGITVLNGDKDDPEQALVEFLEALWSKVQRED